jgi:hypothetical protein
MARKNLDQSLNEPKNKLIKFNEQIANKYKSGLNFKYLDNYLQNNILENSIKDFISLNKKQRTSSEDFKNILKNNSSKNIDWFFDSLVETREIIDYSIGKVTKTKDSIQFKVKNKYKSKAPISIYQVRNDSIIAKYWLTNITQDSLISLPRQNADRIILNYNNEVPEYNLRNNSKSLKGFLHPNRKLKFSLYKDLEDPRYNQVFYVPEFGFNIYDGVTIGLNIDNKSILDKPFAYSISPTYATNTGTLIGGVSTRFQQNIRDNNNRLYRVTYGISASTSHYAEDANYTSISPTVTFNFRDTNFRSNKSEFLQLKQLYIDREKTDLKIDTNTENYNIFNLRYGSFQSETTKYLNYLTDFQLSSNFSKISAEVFYSKLFEDNRRISIRLYTGAFVFRDTKSEFFSFGLDRPTDYLFQYNLLGRSESTGIFSQQYVYGEGGFKSKLATRYANQWISTVNTAFNIWNWVEVYGDVGLLKNKFNPTKFVYDSGLHLNLVPGYFQLFFPVYSSNGYELNDPNYSQKIRFVITVSPKTLISLFTRKWL